jgi:hypothetical protein
MILLNAVTQKIREYLTREIGGVEELDDRITIQIELSKIIDERRLIQTKRLVEIRRVVGDWWK